jgi:hypothetical protein
MKHLITLFSTAFCCSSSFLRSKYFPQQLTFKYSHFYTLVNFTGSEWQEYGYIWPHEESCISQLQKNSQL